MKRKNEFLFILILLLFSFTGYGQDNQYRIEGKIGQQFNGKQIMLFAFDDGVILKVDTAEVVNGVFNFTGHESLKDIAILTIGNYPDTVVSQIVILDKGNIAVDMDKRKVSGTFLNDLYQVYLDTAVVFGKELEASVEKGDEVNFVKTGSPRHKKLIEIGKYKVNFKKQNINNIVGQYFFEKENGRSFAEEFAFPSSESCPDSAFYVIYNAANDDYKQKKWVQKYLESLKRKSQLLEQRKQQIGKQYIDFELKDLSGNNCKISDYIGKSRFILLDFWASWCAPCIAAFPELKDVYSKYNRDDFEIIGISLDTNENSWRNMLQKVDAPWVQLIGRNSKFEEEIMKAYSFEGIPYAVLVDKNGEMVYSGHYSAVFEQILSQFINRY